MMLERYIYCLCDHQVQHIHIYTCKNVNIKSPFNTSRRFYILRKASECKRYCTGDKLKITTRPNAFTKWAHVERPIPRVIYLWWIFLRSEKFEFKYVWLWMTKYFEFAWLSAVYTRLLNSSLTFHVIVKPRKTVDFGRIKSSGCICMETGQYF
jgi:hypothetical protein